MTKPIPPAKARPVRPLASGWLAFGLFLVSLFPLISGEFADDRLVMYPYACVTACIAALTCIKLARSHWGLSKPRWTLLCLHFVLQGLAYIPASLGAGGLLHARETGWLIDGCTCLSIICLLLSLASLSPRRELSFRAVDTCLVLLLAAIRFIGVMSFGPSGYSNHHLYVSFVTTIFLSIGGVAAYLSSASRSNVQFAALVTRYLLVTTAVQFFTDIVNSAWTAHPQALPYNLLFAWPTLFFCWDGNRILKHRRVHDSGRQPRSATYKILPSTLAFAASAIAAYAFFGQPLFQDTAMLLALALFLLRTHLLYRKHLQEQEALRNTARELQQQVHEDPKTKLGNRKWLAESLDVLSALPRNYPIALFLLDIDDFGRVNETWDYGVGDRILRAVAMRLQQFAEQHPRAACCRLRGDEFALLLPRCTRETSESAAQQLKEALQGIPFDFDYRASVSIGVAVAEHTATLPSLLEQADEQLFTSRSVVTQISA